ncbi:MAG: hypothetical protein ACI82A_003553 [Candidatus Azotimanducaceae bacterium]|jgi:hypothetical protein
MLNQCTLFATLFVLLFNSPMSRGDVLSDLYEERGFVDSLFATRTNLSFRLNYEDVNSELQENAKAQHYAVAYVLKPANIDMPNSRSNLKTSQT